MTTASHDTLEHVLFDYKQAHRTFLTNYSENLSNFCLLWSNKNISRAFGGCSTKVVSTKNLEQYGRWESKETCQKRPDIFCSFPVLAMCKTPRANVCEKKVLTAKLIGCFQCFFFPRGFTNTRNFWGFGLALEPPGGRRRTPMLSLLAQRHNRYQTISEYRTARRSPSKLFYYV
jgi:hypothetical protein